MSLHELKPAETFYDTLCSLDALCLITKGIGSILKDIGHSVQICTDAAKSVLDLVELRPPDSNVITMTICSHDGRSIQLDISRQLDQLLRP